MKKIVNTDSAILPPIELTDKSGASEPAIILPPYWTMPANIWSKKTVS